MKIFQCAVHIAREFYFLNSVSGVLPKIYYITRFPRISGVQHGEKRENIASRTR